ncbi:MAG TPA: hypothetical protein VGI39_31415, partial [Polyangiaceae bacterium]
NAEEVKRILQRRAEFDLFLDYVSETTHGYLAGYRDHRRVFRETRVTATSAAILMELVEARRPLRANTLDRLKLATAASAVRLVQEARKAVDVHLMVRGKERRKEWRSIHREGDRFVFEPGAGVRWGVLGKG